MMSMAFKTRYVLALIKVQTNQAGWLFIAHGFIMFRPCLSIEFFLQRFLATRIHDEVAVAQRGILVHFPNCREMGILPGITILPV